MAPVGDARATPARDDDGDDDRAGVGRARARAIERGRAPGRRGDATRAGRRRDHTRRRATDDDEEEETCGFCKYMKGGSCRAAFVAWEACVDAAKARDEDFVETCFETTAALRDCMLRDPEYYGPMRREGEGEGVEGERGEGRREGGRGVTGWARGAARRDDGRTRSRS